MYQMIEPFPDPSQYENPELAALASVWRERRASLEASGVFQEFIRRLQREWAIETGIIERLYTWDRGVTEVLIEQGIEASIISHRSGIPREEAEDIKVIIHDHLGIVEWLFDFVKGEFPLTQHFIRGLQAQFTAHQDFTEAVTESGDLVQIPLIKGDYKDRPNNPRRQNGSEHAYSPVELTYQEMERLVDWYRDSELAYPTEVRAAWLHHRFTQIHPFQDGNGRVARALATLVFLRDGLFPLVIRDSERVRYIDALERADNGDLLPLIHLFASRQREAVLQALGLDQQVKQSGRADQIISSALEMLRSKFKAATDSVSVVYQHATALFTVAEARFQALSNPLNTNLKELTPPTGGLSTYQARTNGADNESIQRHFFQNQIVEIARTHDYYANLSKYRSWVRLTLITDQVFEFVISFHGYGPGDSGVMAASSFSYLRLQKEEGGTEMVGLRPASTDLFQFNYVESYETIQNRFNEWLESSIAIALAEWNRSLQG